MSPYQRQLVQTLLSDGRRFRLNEWERNFLGGLIDRDAGQPLREWPAAQLRCTWTSVSGLPVPPMQSTAPRAGDLFQPGDEP